MKTARLFLIMLYVYLAFSIAVPILFYMSIENMIAFSIAEITAKIYIILAILVIAIGLIFAIMSIFTYKKENYIKLIKAWRMTKLYSIPFYVLNFAYCIALIPVFAMLLVMTHGIIVFIALIPIVFTYATIIISGISGVCCICHLRNKLMYPPHAFHYVLQFICVLDIISTCILLQKNKQESILHEHADANKIN